VKKSVVIKAIAKQIKALCAKFPLDFWAKWLKLYKVA
jgi:hypothetical protein